MHLNFVGDISFARAVRHRIEDPLAALFSPELQAKLTSGDFLCGNLEAPLIARAQPVSDNALWGPTHAVRFLKAFSMLSLANNHIFDCGDAGVAETLTVLREHGIRSSGIAPAGDSPIQPVTVTVGQEEAVVVACTTNSLCREPAASGYRLSVIEDPEFLAGLARVVQSSKSTVLLFHGGNEYVPYPPPSLRGSLWRLVALGVRVIVTHHPHVLGGPEVPKKGSLIWYSMGDFLFDGPTKKRRTSGILQIELRDGEVAASGLIPTIITDALDVRTAERQLALEVSRKVQHFGRRLRAPTYAWLYGLTYMWCLLTFQSERLWVILRNKGVMASVRFAVLHLRYVPFYVRRLVSGAYK